MATASPRTPVILPATPLTPPDGARGEREGRKKDSDRRREREEEKGMEKEDRRRRREGREERREGKIWEWPGNEIDGGDSKWKWCSVSVCFYTKVLTHGSSQKLATSKRQALKELPWAKNCSLHCSRRDGCLFVIKLLSC